MSLMQAGTLPKRSVAQKALTSEERWRVTA
jgi:hypothetical protein